jgi:hypothetical protein
MKAMARSSKIKGVIIAGCTGIIAYSRARRSEAERKRHIPERIMTNNAFFIIIIAGPSATIKGISVVSHIPIGG